MSTPPPSLYQSLDISSAGKILESIEDILADGIGEDGLKLLKKLHHHGSLEKHLSKAAAEGPQSTGPDAQEGHSLLLESLHIWANLKNALDSKKDQKTSINVLASTIEGINPVPNIKLQQSWADRMEAMGEVCHGKGSSSTPQGQILYPAVHQGTQENGDKKPAATTKKEHEYREGSSSTNNGTMPYTKKEAMAFVQGRKEASNISESKVKLAVSWADKMEAMEESSRANITTRATSNKEQNHGEGSPSSPSSKAYYDAKEEAILATIDGGFHGAMHRNSVGEDDTHQHDTSHKHVGGQHKQESGTEGFTLIGKTELGPLTAESLNGLIAQGLVVSGTPDGVIAIHGRPSGGENITWKQVLIEGDKRPPATRGVGKQTRAAACAKATHGSQSQLMESHAVDSTHPCQKHRTELNEGSKHLMQEEKPQQGSTEPTLTVDSSAEQRSGHGPLEGSKATLQGSPSEMTWFGCKIKNDWGHRGVGFSALAGPTNKAVAEKESVVFGTNKGSDINQQNSLARKANIQFGTIPNYIGIQRKWGDTIGPSARGNSKLSYIPPRIVNGMPVIQIKSEQFEHMHQDYKNSLIGSFIGKKSTFEYVKDITSTVWNTSNYSMRPYGEYSYCFDFNDPNERRAALELGSIHIASQLFYIQEWKPFIEAELQELKTIPLWVIFHKFPEELRNEKGYSQVASAIGSPMFVDKRTERKETSYARICVEIDTDCAYLDTVHVSIDGLREFKLQAEYKWKPPMCKTCRVFGHTQCPKNKSKDENKEKRAEVLVWKVKKTETKERTMANQNQKNKDVRKEHKEEWIAPAKKHSFKARRVRTCKENGEGSSIPSFNSMYECLKTTSEVQIEEPTDHIDPAGASIS